MSENTINLHKNVDTNPTPMFKILSINPGSTSTKFAVYEDEKILFLHTILHSTEELKSFEKIIDQLDFRKNLILNSLKHDGVDLQTLSAIVGRGGLIRPVASGVYLVNEKMIADLREAKKGEHASNLGGIIAYEISRDIPECKPFIVDPVVVDEMQDVARISGLPQFPRRSMFHALNQKAVARKYAASVSAGYENLNLVIAHLGGGISVSAHAKGKVIDTNQGLGGYGPFSPERSGTIDAGLLVDFCFQGQASKEEIKKMLVGRGGLIAHLGTNDAYLAEQKAVNGDTHAKLIMEAMAYNVAKEIGAMCTVLKGKVDAIILTGGISRSEWFVNYVKEMVSSFGKLVVYPGENEVEALAMGALRVLRSESYKEY